MILYHMSDTLQLGDEIKSNYKGYTSLAEPFIRALNFNYDVFYAMLLNADYVGSVLAKYDLRGMPTHEIKWATEGIFEYIRRKEFPNMPNRLTAGYFFDNIENCKDFYSEGWAEANEDDRAKIKLYEMRIEGTPAYLDLGWFDDAFDLMCELDSPGKIESILELARNYYSGNRKKDGTIEILYEGKAVAEKDMTYMLK